MEPKTENMFANKTIFFCYPLREYQGVLKYGETLSRVIDISSQSKLKLVGK